MGRNWQAGTKTHGLRFVVRGLEIGLQKTNVPNAVKSAWCSLFGLKKRQELR